MNSFKVEITSVPDRDNLVAEIWFGKALICELNQENKNLEIILYNEKEATYNYDDFLEALEEAKRRLLG